MQGGNFRSTPAICKLNHSLRSGAEADEPVGDRKGSTTPVQLLTYAEPAHVQEQVLPVLEKFGVNPSEAVVLAHGRKLACQAAGDTMSEKLGDHRVVLIADACQDVRSRSSDPRVRLKGIRRLERMLLELVGFDDGRATTEAACEAAGIEGRWLRDAALRLGIAADPRTAPPGEYAKAIRATIDGLSWPTHVTRPVTTTYYRTPSIAQWAALGAEAHAGALPWGTVHSVKGQEFPAAIVVLPNRMLKDDSGLTVLDQWEQDVDAEPRRVLYVAASRAQELAILAVFKSHVARVKKILERDGVPFECV